MSSIGHHARAGTVALAMGVALLTSCSGEPNAPRSTPGVSLLRAATGPSVTATDPSYGHQGDSLLAVTITGSGFSPGAVASWERGGVTDPKVHVNSTTYVSATQLTASITIASDASVALYDVAVTTADTKKGIGYSLFAVTYAIAITGTEIAYGANDIGGVVGRVWPLGAFFWSATGGLNTLGSPGRAFGITVDGNSIVGGTTINALNDQAYIYTLSGGVWTRTNLPKDPASVMTRPLSVASDPTSGAATLIGGWESLGKQGSNINRRPRLWVPSLGGWTKINLTSASSDDLVESVSANSIAVGTANNRAAVWSPNGANSWTAPLLIGASGSRLRGVNSAGTIAVGDAPGGSGTVAAYWTNSGTGWSGPTLLAGGCTSAQAIDDSGRIVANGCPSGSHVSPALIAPPYATANVRPLIGLGDNASTTIAQGISRGGTTIAGQSTIKSQAVGVYWRIP